MVISWISNLAVVLGGNDYGSYGGRYIKAQLGFWEVAFLIIILILILVVPSRLPQIMRDLGRAIREFRKALQETEETSKEAAKALSEITGRERREREEEERR